MPNEEKAMKILREQGMSEEEARDFIEGCKEGLRARREGKVRPWSQVKKELGIEVPNRLLTDEEMYKLLGGDKGLLAKFGNARVAQEYRDIAQAEHSLTLKAVGEMLEAKLMLKSNLTISGKTLTGVIRKFVESFKRGEMPE